MKGHTPFFLFLAFLCGIVNSQVVINEVTSRGSLVDATGEEIDWIEIYNTGFSAVNLQDYGLSDDALTPLKWQFPNYILDPSTHMLVLANGVNSYATTNHWETAVVSNDTWKYFIGTSEPASNWETPAFDDGSWLSGTGGIGFGDGDDGTTIGSAISVYTRREFIIDDVDVIEGAKLHADYDDAFVAYLNGVEIARSGNIIGTPPAYNTTANSDHEAGMYAGYLPEEWNIDAAIINSLIVEGDNYLCIQTHNVTAGSSDISGNFWLSFGINTADTYFYAVPAWFVAPYEFNQTNFKLSNTGETLYLSDPSGAIIDSKYTGDIAYGQSVIRKPDGVASWCITTDITPGYTNNFSNCYAGYEPDPVFSVGSGFYPDATLLYLSVASPTAVIRYTTDGSAVTESSPLYTGAILLSANTIIAAKCFSTGGLLPSKLIRNTYFIDEDDYTLPIVSISIDPGSLFDFDTGIYELGCCYDVNYPYIGANFWQPWERYAHIEYFTETGIPQWNKDMSLEIHGGWSRAEAQKGFRVDFNNKYDGDLDYPLWGAKPDMGPINNFNLRSGGQHVWTYKFQDAFLAKVMKETHIDYEEWQPCFVFINGEAWGLYEIREKADEHFAESNYGVDNNKVDFFNAWSVLNGSDTGFVNMYGSLMSLDPTSTAYFNKFNQYVDYENYMDYYIGEIYYQNVDFGGYYWGANNMKLWREQNGGKFRFIMYDMDGAMGYFGEVPGTNYINLTRNPSYPNTFSQLFDRTLNNIPLRNYFVNRFADLINTIYLQDNMEEIIYSMRDSIVTEIPHQLSAWGAPTVATMDAYIETTLDYNYTRRNTARAHINSSFGLGGQRTVTLAVEPAGAGYIKLNTIIPTDLPWSGTYFDGVPVTMTAIANPGYTFNNWSSNDLIPGGSTDISISINMEESETFTANFTGTPETPAIIITEINYNSNNDFDAGDWIEIYNNSDNAIDISEWTIRDASDAYKYIIPYGTVLSVAERLIIAQKPELFAAIYPSVSNVVGGFNFEFDNSGDNIRIVDIAGNTITSVQYSDAPAWPVGADGTGRTLELVSFGAVPNNPISWFDGCLLGSPGFAYTPCNDAVLFDEINYNSSAAFDAGDWVEILNATTGSIDLSGWRFVDADDEAIFVFEDGLILEANERLVIANDITKFNTIHPTVTNYIGPFTFGLNSDGDELRLFNAESVLQFTMIYNNDAPWPVTPDGGSYTLELLDANGKMNNADNWFAGCQLGSPAEEFNPDCLVDIDNLVEGDFAIYPNPAHTYFIISTGDYAQLETVVQIIDASGKIIQEQSVIASDQIIVNTTQLSAGIYWVKISNATLQASKALVIEN